MGIIYAFLIVLEALLSALLIAVIFMQKTKGGMGGTAFGGGAGEAIFGSRMGNVLTKATVVMGSMFLVNTILLTILTAQRGTRGSIVDTVDVLPVQAPPAQQALPMTMPEAMPAIPVGSSEIPMVSEAAPVSTPAVVPVAPVDGGAEPASAPVIVPAPVIDAVPSAATPAE
ncbi:MAG TPA: preprotein translocase subunit SecG [Verrucomicrobia bacterium]|nr:preprotein translocase subunit SecG [Verrucomicrobiota bacterium]